MVTDDPSVGALAGTIEDMNRPGLGGSLAILLCGLAGAAPAPGQAHSGALADAARSEVRKAWEKEVRPFAESALTGIEVHAVQRRDRLAPGREIYLAHALAEASWWKHSRHYLLLLGTSQSGFEVLYRFDGGIGGRGIAYRLVNVGSDTRRFALEISDHGFEDDLVTGTWTVLVLYLPEVDGFVEVFRELTTYRPASAHGYASTLSLRPAEGPIKDLVVRTELFEDGRVVEGLESTFTWQTEGQSTGYLGVMPLPEAWRAELPARIRRGRP